MTTIDDMKPDAKRLLDAGRDLKHLRNFAALARFIGESEQTLTNWKSRGIPKSKTVSICQKLGCRPEWLETGQLPMTDRVPILPSAYSAVRENRVDYSLDTNVEMGPAICSAVPLITWDQAMDWQRVVDNFSANEPTDAIPTTIPVRQHTYALRVVGDSMTNPGGWPSFPEGVIIFVEPELEHQPGDFVIVSTDGAPATFKQIIRDGEDWFLKPLNPRYPIKPLPASAQICGVVRGYGGIIR